MTVAARRLPILALGAVSLVAGLAAGLSRAGIEVPAAQLALAHGPLMVSAFFGTVIGLERAVAARRRWAYAAPLACGAGGIMLVAGLGIAGAVLVTLGSVLFLAVMLAIARSRWDGHLVILVMGACCWATGNLAWLLWDDVGRVVVAWAAFLVLTIFGERVELGRFGPPLAGKHESANLVAACLVVSGFFGLAASGIAWPVFGAALLLAAAWLWRYDVARHTIRLTGLTRYIAICLLSGYAWLAVAGVWAMAGIGDAFAYDAVLHALFVGFVFSMVFGHAPVILPAVLGIKLPFNRLAYGALAALHLSLALRLAGDAMADPDLRAMGTVANAATLGGWIVLNLVTALRRR
ncbi:MAG TPA: hypothetical protein VLL76_04795 [Candidatus Omnitrophota bacterium]|nr:hypothetical protein [Candidatus Omnitrophota bacterium]